MLTQGDTNLIALLTIRSLNMDYTPTGDAILADLTTLELPPRELRGHTAMYGAPTFPRTASIWQPVAAIELPGFGIWLPGKPSVFSGNTSDVDEVAFSPDGKYIVTAGYTDRTCPLIGCR